MSWSNDEVKNFRATCRNLTDSTNDDVIIIKEKIREILCKTKVDGEEYEYSKLLHWLLDPTDKEKCETLDDCFGKLVKPSMIWYETSTSPSNYIAYKVSFDEVARYNETCKYVEITFVVMCNQKTNIVDGTSICRHDTIASLLKYNFDWINIFGSTWKLITDKESTTDTQYATRTLVYQAKMQNSLVKNNMITNRNMSKIKNVRG